MASCVGVGAAFLATSAAAAGEAANWVQVGGTLAGTALLVWAIRHAYKEVARAHKEVADTHAAMRMLCLEVADKCTKCPLAQGANMLAREANKRMMEDDDRV